jgi:hypothetical protein
MAEKLRDRVLENLATGSALGFLTLIIAVLSLVELSRSVVVEKDSFAEGSASVVMKSRVDDPDFDRVYEIREASRLTYGVVFAGRSRDASALFGATFSPKGELRDLKLIGSCSSRLPGDAKEALASFVGAEEALDRAAKAAIAAAEGDS